MGEIVLSTLNARYAHASLGLRYLLANLRPEFRSLTVLREFVVKEDPMAICEAILAERPLILGLGVYIWNVAQTTVLVRALRARAPALCIVLGGPEVSHETEQQPIVELADHVVCGEGEMGFDVLCHELLQGRAPAQKILRGELPSTTTLKLPYGLYSAEDLRHRVVYVEASRGCPFKCEFCLSSLDERVRDIPLDRFLLELQRLLDRGARQFKFIDRTFNLKISTACAILDFFLQRLGEGLFLHFELVPDRLPPAIRERLQRFPPGAVQLEVGIQTFDETVSRRVSRRLDALKVEENLRFLRRETGVHLHTDLIVGLPGETLEGFGAGFDRLYALRPQEIQVGILKRLRGTPIVRHDSEWGMVYSPDPPYEILETRSLSAESVARMRRFARYWDLFHNSGDFRDGIARLWPRAGSPFTAFLAFSDWVYRTTGKSHGLSLDDRLALLFRYLVEGGRPEGEVGPMLLADYLRPVKRRVPLLLKPYGVARDEERARLVLPRRQARHLS